MKDIERVIALLKKRRETISVAESVTGGELAAKFTELPGSSEVFLGGVVAYSISSKIKELGIARQLIKKFGVYSEEVAVEMAKSVRAIFQSDWAISSTGVAGPGPDGDIPAGTIWIAISGPTTSQTLRLSLNGTRPLVRSGAVTSALATLERILDR
jgi:nicotinamide-nucleotide amidase